MAKLPPRISIVTRDDSGAPLEVLHYFIEPTDTQEKLSALAAKYLAKAREYKIKYSRLYQVIYFSNTSFKVLGHS
jgi:hypothetical protein